MKLYLAGPMSWHPQFNFPLFDETAHQLRAKGYDIVSPAELDDPVVRKAALASPDGEPNGIPHGQTWGDFLSRDVKLIGDEVDGVAVMPEWWTSKGARLEAFCCWLTDKPVYSVMDILGGLDPRPFDGRIVMLGAQGLPHMSPYRLRHLRIQVGLAEDLG